MPSFMQSVPTSLLAVVAVVTLLAVGALIACRSHYKINIFWGVLAALFGGAALFVCALGYHAGTIYAKPSGDPQAVVEEFFEAVIAQDYDSAYGLLKDYSDLGLAQEPTNEAGRLAHDALLESFDYELVGDCQVELLNASQKVSLRYLDLTSISASVRGHTMDKLKEIVQSRSHDEVYDEKDQYLPQVTNEAYIEAVRATLDEAERYYVTVEFELPLEYTGGKWMMKTSPELLKALTGGTGS